MYFYAFRIRLLAAIILTYCGAVVPGWGGDGQVEIPANSSVAAQASISKECNFFYWHSGISYALAPANETWESNQRWAILRYNSSLQLLDSSDFPVHYMERPVSLFRCGERLLLLGEVREDDSLKLIGRWFDVTAKPLSDETVLVSTILEGDDERQDKSSYIILPSSDSTHFLVRNVGYKEDDTYEVGMWVFNSRLELLQNKLLPVAHAKEFKTVQIDNTGALYTVRNIVLDSCLVQRSLPSGSTLDISVPIARLDTLESNTGTAFLVPENENESYLFSIALAGETSDMKKLLIHSCNWKTGKAEVVTNYLTDERVARKVAGDTAMGHFRLQHVFSTPQGFVVWAEFLADSLVKTYHRNTTTETWMVYGGTTGLFAFDKKGALLWQRGIIEKRLVGSRLNNVTQDRIAPSLLSIVNDTLSVFKYEPDDVYNASHIFSPRYQLVLSRVALSSGEASAPVPVIGVVGWIKIPGNRIWCIDRKNILIPCYEPDNAATRLMHLRL